MKVKSYKARNVGEALEMVRTDMGPSALIIQTRPFRQGGILGLMASEGVEVVAASDDAPPPRGAGRAEPGLKMLITGSMDGATFKHIYDRLLAQGVLPHLARAVVEEALCRYPSSPFSRSFPDFGQRLEATAAGDGVLQAFTAAVAKNVRVERSTRPASGPKLIALVGPTGVGKTTTIAKLATISAMRHSLATALVTLDTYRIGAVDQLRGYAELLGVPLAVVQRPEQLPETLAGFSDRAVVFVDTIGRSPKDAERVAALKPFFRFMPCAETHLVVNCTSKYEDALLAARSFGALPVGRLIFSKADESTTFGSVFNIAHQTKLPLSYLTVGQEVPDDIEVTTPSRLAHLLLDEHPETHARGPAA